MRKKLIFALFIMVLIALFCLIPYRNAVVFYKDRPQEILAFAPLIQNQSFQIKYIHSIHLSPVVETYEGTSLNEIRQIELMYEDFAIGMPSEAEGEEKFVQADGKYYIKNMNRIFPYIYLRVGEVKANHTVIIDDKAIPMTTFTEAGSVIKIQISNLSIFDQWKGVNIID